MRVIGSGFGRTGTLSLQAALQQLGFGPCYHMVELARRPTHIHAWHAIAHGSAPDWHALLQGFESTVDFPACIFYAELLAAFPDAKVLHSVRSSASWYASTRATIYRSRDAFPSWLLRASRSMRELIATTDRLIWDGVFQSRFEDQAYALQVFDQHTRDVQARVPADRLLVYDVREGWEPLCRFLCVPVPSTPFPHRNDRVTMQRALWLLRYGLRALPWFLLTLIVAGLVRWIT